MSAEFNPNTDMPHNEWGGSPLDVGRVPELPVLSDAEQALARASVAFALDSSEGGLFVYEIAGQFGTGTHRPVTERADDAIRTAMRMHHDRVGQPADIDAAQATQALIEHFGTPAESAA